uniref:Transposon Ty3-I Gag-Pol polyprotein n=1 Tax=Cajanus cajan TaxID=3821 RepID=A0A151RA49_CAJCA|nr:Transposon Ty3-I Gag-Pol polyprotein [Cajanus cajan]
MGGERAQAVKEETTKLLQAGFIREVKYSTWLANVVMVKKVNGKWRMCTDYTDLNKACPKDAYPLPHIDALVDGAAGHQRLSFLDANPNKCQAIVNMRSPRNVKEVQRLAGRIASLARFLPCMVDKSRPIMSLLKKTTKFQWTEECESSFQNFKLHVLQALEQRRFMR